MTVEQGLPVTLELTPEQREIHDKVMAGLNGFSPEQRFTLEKLVDHAVEIGKIMSLAMLGDLPPDQLQARVDQAWAEVLSR